LKELLTAGPHLSASGAKRKGRRRCWAGGEGRLGQRGPSACVRKKRKGRWPWVGPRAEEKVGPAGRKEREREEKRISFFFLKFLFKFIFQTFKLQSNKKSMHSNHDAQTLIISKLF
jgi:hypothetical protein